MTSLKRQHFRVLQPYLTPPADGETSVDSAGSAALSTMSFSVLDVNYESYCMKEIWGSSLLLNPNKSKSSAPYTEFTSVFSLSKTFHSEHLPLPDATLLSSDGVFFCVHLETIHRDCPKAFQSFLDASSSPTIGDPANPAMLDCSSEVLNIILHVLYNMSLDAYTPGPEAVAAAIDHMPGLGITVKRVIYPECALYRHILSYTPLCAMDVYAMAAHHDIHALAVHASSYLLNLNIQTVSDDACIRMGPLYLLKLIRLHAMRFDALKAELLIAPPTHSPSRVDNCSFGQQQQTKQIWALFFAEPMWHTRSIDLAIQAMEVSIHPMMEDLTCTECSLTLHKMVARVRSQWLLAP